LELFTNTTYITVVDSIKNHSVAYSDHV